MKEFFSDLEFDFRKDGFHCFVKIKYKLASHWDKVKISKDKEETMNQFLERVYKEAHGAIREFEMTGYKETKTKKEKKEADYKGKPTLIMKDKDELLYSSASNDVLNKVLDAYSAGLPLGKTMGS